MPYNPIEIDRRNLSIMGVNFSSVNNFEAAIIDAKRLIY